MSLNNVIPMWLTLVNSSCKYGCKGLEITSAGKVKYRESPGTAEGCRLPGAKDCCLDRQTNTAKE